MPKKSKIILASTSRQRLKLMRQAGFSFTVQRSSVEERRDKKGGCAELVKHNALLKAKDVAQNQKNAIVIGADTLAYAGDGRIIGKPRDIKEAKKVLRILCSRPQWIYTGVALINTRTNKVLTDYEKTKVFMRKLGNREIDRYYQMISPFDKAGGFDIEGKGSLFIERIEGCFSNVVGLPIAKLCKMLQEIGVRILSLILICLCFGCATEYNLATQKQETYLYSTEKEAAMGANMAMGLEKEYKISDNTLIHQRLQEIGDRLVAVCDRKDLVFTFKVIDDKEIVNALALPGGFIYIFQGLIKETASDDELASVLAHEIGHVAARHNIKKIQTLYGYTFLKLLAMQTNDPDAVKGVDAAFLTAFTAYSQNDELEADRLSVKYLKRAGYDPMATVSMLKTLKRLQEKEPTRKHSYWRTHPYLSKRIAAARQAVSGKMEFRDYINIR